MQKTIKLGLLGRIAVILFAVIMTLSVLSPLYQIDGVSAATAFSASTTVYINDDSYADFQKTGISVVAEFYNGSTKLSETTLTTNNTNYYSYSLKTASNGSTSKIRLVRKDTSVPSVNTAVESGKQRIYFNNTAGWSTVKAYSWYMNGSDAFKGLGEWPGTNMTKIGTSNYYYIDVPTASNYIIFNNDSGTQTDNLTIDASGNNLYTFSNNLWSEYGVASAITVDVAIRPNNTANTIFVTGESSYKWSKYALPLTTAKMTTVYVKATSWSNAYVSYDPNDPLSMVTNGSYVDINGNSSTSKTGYFKLSVPLDSTFIFKPNSGTDNAGSTDPLSQSDIPTNLSKPCYNVITKKWQELSQVDDTLADYKVTESFPDNILAVKATYYDYLSDDELTGSGWLYPTQSGTGHTESNDDWYPFYEFNKLLSNYARSNTSWSLPLYFGNFCNTTGAYPNSNEHGSVSGWSHVTNSTNAYKFDYPANNSNALAYDGVSYQGLVHSSLVNDQLYVNSSVQAPYFNNEWLMNNTVNGRSVGKVIDGYFPFTIEKENGYNKYSFNSEGAEDNVYFTWATSGTHTYPTKVNYAAGTNYGGTYYGIDDGLKYFMYQTASGKGIFPFNNASGTKGVKTYSNDNLNYGFGIRMDIDFRVPTNGLVPNTSTPIQFDFTGDDDLWVYITDNETGVSQLVLDMGGAHKKSHGSINFNTKKATVDLVHTGGENDPRYVYLSKDNTNWDSRNTYAYFWNDSGTVGNEWPGYNMSSYSDGGSNLRVGIPKDAKYVKFCNYYDNTTHAETSNITLSTSNGAFWLSSSLGVNNWDSKPSDAGLDPTPATAASKTKSFTFDNSDDQKTYTMSVFYMERGLIESNMSINFTMTPLDNDLTVAKNIDTTDVNPGLVDELLTYEKFDYTVYDDNALATNKSYTHTTETNGSTSSDGMFYLMDDQRARFNAQFDTNSAMKIVESSTSKAGLSYSTSWKLSDNNTGASMDSGTSTTSQFNLINSNKDADTKTSLYLEYTNKSLVGPIKVQKKVIDENSRDISSTSNAVFDYKIAFDLYEDAVYDDTLDLTYSLYNSNDNLVGTYTAVDGAFSIKGGQYVIFNGIPIGTKYKITEQVKDGYNLYSATVNGSATTVSNNTVSGTVTSTNNVFVTNMYKPVGATLTAYKTLDGDMYNGNDFTFKVTGFEPFTLNGVETKDTSTAKMEESSASNGLITFSNKSYNAPFTYSEAGTYCYKIEEVIGSSTAYIYDTDVYYAKVVVTANASTGSLSVATPVYYSDSAFSKQIAAMGVVFENKSAACELQVAKMNFNRSAVLDDGEFKLVAATYDSSKKEWVEDTNSQFAPVVKEVIEDSDSPYIYCAKFENVPQGDYLVIETRAPSGYELSAKPQYVKVERTSTNNGVVTFEFADVETSALPLAGGSGFMPFICAGVVSLCLSLLFFGFRGNKTQKAYNGKRFK